MTEKNIKTNIEVTDNGKEIAAIDAIPPIAPSTIARTIVFALAWVNQLFAFIGLPVLEFDQEGAYLAISTVITLGASAWAAWKDNAFTIAARIGNLVMKAVKKEDAKIGLHGKVN